MLLTKKSEYALLSLVSIAQSNTPKNVDQLATELKPVSEEYGTPYHLDTNLLQTSGQFR